MWQPCLLRPLQLDSPQKPETTCFLVFICPPVRGTLHLPRRPCPQCLPTTLLPLASPPQILEVPPVAQLWRTSHPSQPHLHPFLDGLPSRCLPQRSLSKANQVTCLLLKFFREASPRAKVRNGPIRSSGSDPSLSCIIPSLSIGPLTCSLRSYRCSGLPLHSAWRPFSLQNSMAASSGEACLDFQHDSKPISVFLQPSRHGLLQQLCNR